MSNDSFFSIDRLVEFGMGMAMAQQMVQTMNYAMNNMQVPGVDRQIPNAPQAVYYAIIEGQQAGPFSESEMGRLVADKKITSSSYVWKPGMPNWKTAENVPDVLKIVALNPPTFKPE